jgi:hypothetical protein
MLKNLASQLNPDSEGLLVQFLITVFGIHWKTSLNGFVMAAAVLLLGLSSLMEALAKIFEADAKVSLYIAIATAVIAFPLAVCRGWVGLIQLDSGMQAIKLPSVDEPVGVRSHETPDDPIPGAKIVKQ